MLTEKIRTYASVQWKAVRPGLGRLGEDLQRKLEKYTGDCRVLLELTLGTLPALDLAQVDFDTWVDYAQHALFLRENSPYCKDVPEDIFLHNVFYPRINNEDIVPCRSYFYHLAWKSVEGHSPKEAALAVNRWCAGEMTYESTDNRTINPITAYRCGLGRCGEESTFCVSVMRSVGIPARQIYAPWWSHCDDNHAWVEVYADGDWHYLGACEPEPVLNRGWFNSASSRAMGICSRRFFDYGEDREKPLGKLGCCLLDNQTQRYCQTVSLRVQIPDPGENAWVRVYVFNMASLMEIAAVQPDAEGWVSLELGQGSCVVEGEKDGKFTWSFVTLEKPVTLTLCPDCTEPKSGILDMDFMAPAAKGGGAGLTQEQSQRREKEQHDAQAARKRKKEALPTFQTGNETLDYLLMQAGANAEKLLPMIEEEVLQRLPRKDWRDAEPQVLESFLQKAPQVKELRIGWEKLTDWIDAVKNQVPEDVQKDPEGLWTWLGENFREGDCRFYPSLWADPKSTLRLGAGDEKGRSVLFVAVLRLNGIEARLSPVSGKPQYLDGDRFRQPGKQNMTFAKLTISGLEEARYGIGWSVSRWERGWKRLNLDSTGTYVLPVGIYQLVTCNRLPNGNQLVRMQVLHLDQDMQIRAERRQAKGEQLLAHFPITLKETGLRLSMYLEVGAEPTEHALNELMECEDQVGKGEKIHLVLPGEQAKENGTLQKVLKKYPKISLETADFRDASMEALARNLYLEPGVWPLLVVTDGKTGFYGHCGYAVGSVPMALELMALAAENR